MLISVSTFISIDAYNRTMLELKFAMQKFSNTTTEAYNRTMLELKFAMQKFSNTTTEAYNRTMLELKFTSMMGRSYDSSLIIVQCLN